MTTTATKVNAVWTDPTSTDPGLLINRDAELTRLVDYLRELRVAGKRERHILVTGARGVGKSIFTRAALDRFQRELADHVVTMTVDCRSLKYRPFLSKLAIELVSAVLPRALSTKRTELAVWLDQLNLFARHAEVSRSLTETVTRKYGVSATVGTDQLLYKLQSSFSWEESRSAGMTTQSKIVVTDELLHDAIGAMLARLAEEQAPWFVAIFLDNMDQTSLSERAEDVESLFRRVLELSDCVTIAHFRTETLIENVRREADFVVELEPLSSATLYEILRRRLEASVEVVRDQFPPSTDWTAVHALASVTGNALVFLRWVQGLLVTQRWPPPAGWTEAAALDQIVRTAEPLPGADAELLQRLLRVVDRCDGGVPGAALMTPRLLAASDGVEGLSEREVELLARLFVLLPKHRYEPELGYRLSPVLDLLRPSVREKLRTFMVAHGKVD